MNTNDPLAEYGKREPLLGEYEEPPYFSRYDEDSAGAFYDGVNFARDFYEAKIASGELIVANNLK